MRASAVCYRVGLVYMFLMFSRVSAVAYIRMHARVRLQQRLRLLRARACQGRGPSGPRPYFVRIWRCRFGRKQEVFCKTSLQFPWGGCMITNINRVGGHTLFLEKKWPANFVVCPRRRKPGGGPAGESVRPFCPYYRAAGRRRPASNTPAKIGR